MDMLCSCFQSFLRPASDRPAWDRTASLVNRKLRPSTRDCSLGWSSCNVREGCLENLLNNQISSMNIKPSSCIRFFFLQGLVRAVGVSNYGPQQLVKIHDYLRTKGVPLCSAQVQFSLLSMGKEQLEIKSVCDELGVRLISYSPLGLGMLTGKYSSSKLPNGPRLSIL